MGFDFTKLVNYCTQEVTWYTKRCSFKYLHFILFLLHLGWVLCVETVILTTQLKRGFCFAHANTIPDHILLSFETSDSCPKLGTTKVDYLYLEME